MTAESKSLVERLRDGADLYGSDQFATTLHEAANLIERLEREREEASGREGHLTGCIEKLTRERDAARARATAQARSAADDENEACARVAELCDPTTYVASNIRARRKGEANVG